jgi:hypothetical protein
MTRKLQLERDPQRARAAYVESCRVDTICGSFRRSPPAVDIRQILDEGFDVRSMIKSKSVITHLTVDAVRVHTVDRRRSFMTPPNS